MSGVVVVGSLNLDHVISVCQLPVPGQTVAGRGYLAVPGGKGLNQAVTAARQGVPVAMVGCVGEDAEGQLLKKVLSVEGVDTTRLRTAGGVPSGTALATVAAGGANTVVVAAGANGELGSQDVQGASELFRQAGALLVQLEVPLSAVRAALGAARACGTTTVLNPAPVDGPLSGDVLSLVDVLVPNETEALALSGRADPHQAAAWLLSQGCGCVLVTLGAQGAMLAGKCRRPVSLPAYDVEAIDTTAAGDAFCGALAAALAAGDDVLPAARRAGAAGALATTVMGAFPSLPRAADVDRLLAAQQSRHELHDAAPGVP
jgi:ribokinase